MSDPYKKVYISKEVWEKISEPCLPQLHPDGEIPEESIMDEMDNIHDEETRLSEEDE